ncbi:DNA polymerase III subunit delta [Alsobacter sp. SYSU M60028]|uniref:DNA-directed DNA polymerase n=1 Tax=Alsobacter ponti TaxID=2962936 RepID=A0ABT1LB62_9HYPH|nr:DNA polymerase III subunit delta [Alsobacter ponti]MCP8938725.1 DNA polymerase III subunit delta [Alsobacter ponti]
MASRKAHEVDAWLRRPDPASVVVLVYGPNTGLVNERARALARGAVDDPEDAFQLVRMDGDAVASDPLRLADEANTVGLFGGRRALWVRAGGRNLLPAVQPLLAEPPRDTLVVIEAGDLANKNPLRAAVEASRAGMALPCYADEARDLPALIDGAFREFGLTATREARDELVGLLGADRLLSRRELEKLATYAHGQDKVTPADIEAVMADASALALDTVVDAVFLGDLETMDRGLARLFREGEDASMTLLAALRHAISLHKARVAVEGGASMESVLGAARLFFKRKAAFQRQVTRWPSGALESAIASLREGMAAARRNGGLGEAIASRVFLTIAMRVARG